jgi:glycosyltransferase involved in cell wall biosynthesis
MRVSVITVSYNSAATIGETLTSVAAQTWPDVEHIVVDGASTDGTLAVVERLGGHVARVVSERDRGIYDAMNKGIAIATGEIICFLNADDHYANANVLDMVTHAMAAGDLDAALGDVEFFVDTNPRRFTRRYRSSRFRPDRLAWGWMPAHPALFVRRRVFDRVGSFAIDYKIAGDYEWIARAFHQGTLEFQWLPAVLVHMQAGGISTRGWQSTLLLNREVMRACRTNGISTNWFKLLSKYPAKLLEFVRP